MKDEAEKAAMADDKASKRAENKAQLEAAAEAVDNWNERQKLHALGRLLRDPELKKAAMVEVFEVWESRQSTQTRERLHWLKDAFAKRYQRVEKDGTTSPRVREARTQQVVERLVAFALSAAERDRKVEKDLGLFEYTADEVTREALLSLSDRIYGYQVKEKGYHQAQALLRKIAEQYGELKVDGKTLVELVGSVQSGLKTVGKLDLGLPERVVGLRTAKEEAEYQRRFAAYLKGLETKAAAAEKAAKGLEGKGGN